MSKELLLKQDVKKSDSPNNEDLKEQGASPVTKVNETPAIGKIFFIISGVIFCLNFMCGKILYDNHPTLNANLLLLYRSGISIILLIAVYNIKLKKIMYETVTSAQMPALAIRIITGNLAIFVNFNSVNYFTLTIVAMMINCAPIITTFAAPFILGEKVLFQDVLSLIVAFGGIALMILGGDPESKNNLVAPSFIAYVILVLNPVCLAAGNLAMRGMKELEDAVVACYMSLSLFIIFFLVCSVSGNSIWYIQNFSFVDWICLIAISIGTILSQSLRFMALKIHTVSGLQPYTFLQPLQQFLTDLLVFGHHFSIMQFIGVQLLIFVYLAQYCLNCFHKIREMKKEDLNTAD